LLFATGATPKQTLGQAKAVSITMELACQLNVLVGVLVGPNKRRWAAREQMSDGSKVGDTWYFTATTGTSCAGYASGVTFSVTTNWTTTLVKPYCGRGGCAMNYSYQLTGGSGVATYVRPTS